MKNLATITFAILFALSASAAVPAEWEVELSTQPPQVFSFQRPCGETIELEAVIKYHGKPYAPDITNACIFWQTNGMNNLYWSAPASVSNHIFRATWLPSMDPGATFVRGYIGDPGSIYAAAFQLRFIGSPGAVPSELPLPVKTLDFAQVTVLNPPYYTQDETDARILELAPVPGNYSTVSNRAMNAVQPAAIADMETQTHAADAYQPKGSYLTTESDPSVDGKINTHNSSTTAHSDIRTALAGKQPTIDDLATIRTGAAAGATAVQPGDDISFSREVFDPSTLSLDRYNYQIGADGIRAGRQFGGGILMLETTWFNSDSIGFGDNNAKIYFPSVHSGTFARLEDMPTDSTVSGWGYLKEEEDPTVDAKLAPITTAVNSWQTYWGGDDVRVTITSNYGSQDLPTLCIEQKISEGGTNYFKTIWTEQASLGLINSRLRDIEADVETKADRAWGFYDSHSGTWAPDGFTSISSGSILISKDMSYQKNITSGGEVWVLTSNDPTVISGTETNGFFKIADSEGNSIFEVVKGDKRVVPATVSAVSAGGNSLTINFNVVSTDHPSLEICSDLVEADWKAEDEASCPATVSWSGSSGNYIATVTGKAAMPKMFVKGTYEIGGETFIKNAAPVGFEKVVIGGVFYRVAVETVNGKKLMVLTEE